MEANNDKNDPKRTQDNTSEPWKNLMNSLTGGKNLIDISKKGVDINILGFSAGIGVGADQNAESTNSGLKAQVSTPWGSSASTGIQGSVGSSGLGGGLWVRAALTPDIAAKAGLGGNISKENISGGLTAGAKTPITGEHVADLSGDWQIRKEST